MHYQYAAHDDIVEHRIESDDVHGLFRGIHIILQTTQLY